MEAESSDLRLSSAGDAELLFAPGSTSEAAALHHPGEAAKHHCDVHSMRH